MRDCGLTLECSYSRVCVCVCAYVFVCMLYVCRSMQWKENYNKAGLREGNCLPLQLQVTVIIVVVVTTTAHPKQQQQQKATAAAAAAVVVVVKAISKITIIKEEGIVGTTSSSSLSSAIAGINSVCERHSIEPNIHSGATTRKPQRRLLPTLMGYRPIIQSGDSYDVIRGGQHRNIWLVRR